MRKSPISTDDYLPLSSRREYSRSTNPLRRTIDDSVNLLEEPLSSARRGDSSRLVIEGIAESKAVAGAIRALQVRIKALESENAALKATIADYEAKTDRDRETWKRRLLQEVSFSKDRENELLVKFQHLDAKLKAEVKRIKQAEAEFRDSEAEMTVRLQQTLAENSTLTAQIRKLESDYQETLREKQELEEKCETQETELQTMRQHLTQADLPADPPTFSPAIEDSQEGSARQVGASSLLDDIRREIQQAREAAARPRSLSASSREMQTHERSARQSTESALHRSASLQTFRSERISVQPRKDSYIDSSRLVSAPSPPLLFNPTSARAVEAPRVSFRLTPKSDIRRGPVKAINRYLSA